MRYPVDNRIVIAGLIPFGDRDSAAKYGRHAGDDSANATGTPVYAPASGVVTPYTWGQYSGNVVEIFDGTYYPHIFHLSRQTVVPGQRVKQGQLVGYSGVTGQGVTGPHIHFGVSKVSVPNTRSFADYLDPIALINSEGDIDMADVEDLKNHIMGVEAQVDEIKRMLQELNIAGRFEDLKANVLANDTALDKKIEDVKAHVINLENKG